MKINCTSSTAFPRNSGSRTVPGDRARLGLLTLDLVAALGVLGLAILPLAFSFWHERQLLHAEYVRVTAMEIVDGETEILAAGGWKQLPDGSQNYSVESPAAAALPAGHFQATRTANLVRLEWLPEERYRGFHPVRREFVIP